MIETVKITMGNMAHDGKIEIAGVDVSRFVSGVHIDGIPGDFTRVSLDLLPVEFFSINEENTERILREILARFNEAREKGLIE